MHLGPISRALIESVKHNNGTSMYLGAPDIPTQTRMSECRILPPILGQHLE